MTNALSPIIWSLEDREYRDSWFLTGQACDVDAQEVGSLQSVLVACPQDALGLFEVLDSEDQYLSELSAEIARLAPTHDLPIRVGEASGVVAIQMIQCQEQYQGSGFGAAILGALCEAPVFWNLAIAQTEHEALAQHWQRLGFTALAPAHMKGWVLYADRMDIEAAVSEWLQMQEDLERGGRVG